MITFQQLAITKGDVVSILNSPHSDELREVILIRHNIAWLKTMTLLGGKSYRCELPVSMLKIIRKVKVLLPRQKSFPFMQEEDKKLDEVIESRIQTEIGRYNKLHAQPVQKISTTQLAIIVADMTKNGKSTEEIKKVVTSLV